MLITFTDYWCAGYFCWQYFLPLPLTPASSLTVNIPTCSDVGVLLNAITNRDVFSLILVSHRVCATETEDKGSGSFDKVFFTFSSQTWLLTTSGFNSHWFQVFLSSIYSQGFLGLDNSVTSSEFLFISQSDAAVIWLKVAAQPIMMYLTKIENEVTFQV